MTSRTGSQGCLSVALNPADLRRLLETTYAE